MNMIIIDQYFSLIQLSLYAKFYRIKYQIIINNYLTFFKRFIKQIDKIFFAILQNIFKIF